jgi:hypothetical protein
MWHSLAARFCTVHGFDPKSHYCPRPSRSYRSALRWRSLVPNDAAMFTHKCVVSVDLAGKSQPAPSDNFQRARLSLIRRQISPGADILQIDRGSVARCPSTNSCISPARLSGPQDVFTTCENRGPFPQYCHLFPVSCPIFASYNSRLSSLLIERSFSRAGSSGGTPSKLPILLRLRAMLTRAPVRRNGLVCPPSHGTVFAVFH